MKPLARRLYAAWQQAVANDKIINQFEAAIDDPSGRWIKGDRITYGVKQVGQQFGYYARNLDQGCDIDGAIAQKTVSSVDAVHKYICRLNSYRALRPGAGTRQLGRQPDIPPEPERCRFHCQDASHPLSLLRREPLLILPLKHFIWKAYYNVAPLDAQGHFLWIPTSHGQTGAENQLTHWLQSLTPELIEDAVELFRQLSDTVLFFNALHAGASVNHIHFQSVSHSQALPIESTSTVDYKGYTLTSDYSAEVAVFSVAHSPTMLIDYIVQLQKLSIPFNLVMASSRIFVVARDSNHAIVSEFPGDGLASLGMCGALVTVSRTAFESVSAAKIESAFKKMVVPARQAIDRFV